jgi:hypothetical protein
LSLFTPDKVLVNTSSASSILKTVIVNARALLG